MFSNNEIKEVSIYTLSQTQVEFLEGIGVIIDSRNPNVEDGIPVYVKNGAIVSFVYDYILKDNKSFESGRKKVVDGELLFRGGGVLMPVIGDDCVVIYDERHSWLRPVAGISKLDEALDLEATAIREGIIEELIVCDPKEHGRIVPPVISDMSTLSLAVHNWNMRLQIINITGAVNTSYTFNDENGAFECVVKWELPGKPADYKFFHQEDWFAGGPSGIVPVTLDKSGTMTGFWSGRQGYVRLPVQKFHPTLKKFWLDAK